MRFSENLFLFLVIISQRAGHEWGDSVGGSCHTCAPTSLQFWSWAAAVTLSSLRDVVAKIHTLKLALVSPFGSLKPSFAMPALVSQMKTQPMLLCDLCLPVFTDLIPRLLTAAYAATMVYLHICTNMYSSWNHHNSSLQTDCPQRWGLPWPHSLP